MGSPNNRLRYYRELWGWSQQKVAEQIQTDMKMVSKWERGMAIPSPHYREKLCKLFGKNALELGLVKTVSSQEISQQLAGDDTDHANKPIMALQSACFSFGRIKTTWIVRDGDGENAYRPQNIHSHYDPHPDPLPQELEARKQRIRQLQEENRQRGATFQWNGERYSLDRFLLSRSPGTEEMILELWFKPSDYYTFLATNMSLEDESLRTTYLQGVDWHAPVRYFSNAFGISLVVVTSDGFALLTRRGKNVGSYPEAYSTSISEGLSKSLDTNGEGQAPDIYHCAARGLAEELGIRENDDFRRADIQLLSFGVDTRYAQWGLRGMVKVNRRAEDILRSWHAGVKDKIEHSSLLAVRFEPDTLISFILSHGSWTPSALISLYHSLVHEFGRKEVSKAMEKYSPLYSEHTRSEVLYQSE
ncbi:MAG: helix-turn-helix transcriptional regulator [Ktedonobacteraceae bacterium]|nr:helix-turn-helix transcriptional regulator [Ktedonobacteraceae bacterium]